MKLHYDSWQDLWYQKETDEKVSFGANSVPLPQMQGKESFVIDVNVKGGNAGPLIGIMASLSSKGVIIGNAPLFKALQHEAILHRGVTIVFPPEGIKNGQIYGFMYQPEKNSWYPVYAPLPHVVYNRVPLRKTEETTAFKQAAKLFAEWRIPFFNPAFIDKSELYILLRDRPFFTDLLPETILIKEKEECQDFFEKHDGIYLKPALSSRGSGIFLVRKKQEGSIEFQSHAKKRIYPSFEQFWEENNAKILAQTYIAQKEISPALLDGRRYDFRVHVHDSIDGYKVTGIGVRQSVKQSLTTHIPNGGVFIPYERVRTKSHDRFFAKLVKEVGKILSEEIGYFGEFSIDAGLTESGEYVLYEVNSKPMEFDEPEIETRRIKKMNELLFIKAGFSE